MPPLNAHREKGGGPGTSGAPGVCSLTEPGQGGSSAAGPARDRRLPTPPWPATPGRAPPNPKQSSRSRGLGSGLPKTGCVSLSYSIHYITMKRYVMKV